MANFRLRTAALTALALACSSCQTAQKPASLLPPATAPALTIPQAAGPSAPAQSTTAQSATAARERSAATVQAPGQDQTTEKLSPPPAEIKQPAEKSASDSIADLIARVQQLYQAGLASYSTGDTEAARKSFDSAFNLLLDSDLDIRSDERLQKTFDQLVADVDKLDVSTSGTDADAQKSEPAPIDETNGLAPAADADAIAKAQAAFRATHSDLPLMMTDQVAGFISYFSGRGRTGFERALARSGRYHDMMLSILKEEGVPQDLIYLAQAESGFHPLAVSRAGARGIWQFMASRGRGYGLQRTPYTDDRQDPVKSTRAAARHLKDLYAQFGDWYLAMAAYNSGPGNVQAAVRRTGFADFWELYHRNVLPKETRNYVPIILAVTIMAKNPSQYGLDSVAMEKSTAYDTVTADYSVDLRLVADCVDSTLGEIQDLNPSLLRLTTPKDSRFELHLRAGSKDQYQAAIAAVPPDMRLWWRYHQVKPGETLASVSRTYHTSSGAISDANHLDGSELAANAKLLIPVPAGKHPLSDTVAYSHHITRYKVRRGDTVETVAEIFGVPTQMVRRWNGLRGDSLRGRRVLAIRQPITPSAHDAEAASSGHGTTTAAGRKSHSRSAGKLQAESEPASVVRHKVKSGESLYSIASTYNTTVAALKRDNRNVASLRPGMILIIQPAR